MLRGRHVHSVDPKGRIAFPARFRDVLKKQYNGTEVVVTKHLTDPCLVLYPLKEWEAFEARVAQLPQFKKSVKELKRQFVGKAQDCSVDKQGRILIPHDLRAEAQIDADAEAIWNGQISFAELWSKVNYERCVESVSEKLAAGQMPELEAALEELGI